VIKAFFSDPHFGHANIIEYCNRPYKDVLEMNRALVHNYNRHIGPDDTVVWLGDCFFKGDKDLYRNILAELAGMKILIVGNHDGTDAQMAALGFHLTMREGVMNIAGKPCRLNHFPYGADEKYEKPDKFKALRPKRRPGEILLHGHTHSHKRVRGREINLSCDAWSYSPAPYAEVESLVRSIS
jgi:calcineurin-like phosphoesterase family protein